jgi:hypothetical protein
MEPKIESKDAFTVVSMKYRGKPASPMFIYIPIE